MVYRLLSSEQSQRPFLRRYRTEPARYRLKNLSSRLLKLMIECATIYSYYLQEGFEMNTSPKKPTSDELLEQIFNNMHRLFNEKELSRTMALLNDLGKILVYSDRCSFWYWDKRSRQLWTLAAHDVGKITVADDAGLVGFAVQNNETLIINDPYSDPRFNQEIDRSTGYRTKSIFVMPVTNADGEVIGAYQALNKLYGEDFTESDAKRLSLAAAFLGKTLESQLLLNASQEDQLTGLRNRRGFFDFYERRILTSPESTASALIICDIDFFKKFNDTYGHNAGDAVLVHVADVFRRLLPMDDGVFRWGGEEFIFILPKSSLDECRALAEKLRAEIEASVCRFEGLELKITMSFGVSRIKRGLRIDENIKFADENLYQAKQNGRNRVVG